MKVVDKMNGSISEGKTFFSFEFFPPRTDEVSIAAELALPPVQSSIRDELF